MNDNDFHGNKKHTFYAANGTGKADHTTMPDYMRHLERKENQVDPTSNLGEDGTLFVVSRNQGWITV